MTSFAEFTKKKKKKSAEGLSFKEYTESLLGVEVERELAPVKTAITKVDAPVKEKKLDFFQKGAFEDGYQFGDVTKSILGTTSDLGVGIVKGGASLVEGIKDLGQYGIAFGADKLGAHEFADSMRKLAQESSVDYATKAIDDFLNKYSVAGRTTDAVAQGVGQLGTMILTAGLGAGAGLSSGATTALTTGTIVTSSAGQGMGEAYKEGATDTEATIYGFTKGAIEGATEMLFGGLGKSVKAIGLDRGLSSLDDQLARKLSSKISNHVLKNATEFGVKASGEGLEEVLAGAGDAVAKKLTYMSDEELKDIIEDENLLEQFVVGTLVSGTFQSGYVPGTSQGSLKEANATGRDFITGYTQNEQSVIDKVVEQRVKEQETDGKKLDNKEIGKIEEEVTSDLQKGYIPIDTIESVLGGDSFKAYNSLVEQENTLKKEIEALENMPREQITVKQGERLTQAREELNALMEKSDKDGAKQRLTEEVNKLIEKDTFLKESYNEKTRRSQQFEADLTKYDEKQQAVIKKAVDSGILNNTNKTHEFVDMIAKISADKGVLFDFTSNEALKESGFAIEGKTVNGYVKDGNIALNINSNKALNTVVGHEITHILEGTELYNELQTAVVEYATTKGDYNARKEALAKLYEGVDNVNLENEITADLVGDYLFTDSDFINSLSTKKPNVFKKIYDEIKYFLKVATAGSKEARQLEQVKRAFDKAYKETAKNTENVAKFDIKKDVDGNLFVDVTEDILDSNSGESTARTIQKVIADKFNNLIDANGQQIQINKTTNDEFRRSNSANALMESPSQAYNDKLRTIANADEILTVAKDWIGEERKHIRKDDIVEFARGNVTYRVGENGYVADVIVATRKNGSAVLYDIVNIYDKKIAEAPVTMASDNNSQRRQDAPAGSNVTDSSQNVNIKYSLNKDSEGHTLSKEQKEYFKDSKIVNENGQLKVMYHGSPAQFTVFDKKKAKSSGYYGKGFYFSESESHAGQYGSKYEVYLNIKNPLQEGTNNITKEQLRKFVNEVAENEDYGIENYGYDATVDSVTESVYGKDDFAMIMDINATSIGDMVEAIQLFNEINGTNYDGIIVPTETVAFYPEQIKSIDNSNPTTNADIRYSLSEDSNGKKLSDEQKEYFKGSKVVDENGNLAIAYHGSSAEFTVFDKNRIGKGVDQFGAGFYFGTTDEISKAYGENQYEVYLNIQKPIKVFRTADGGDLYDVEITKKQAYEIAKRHPNIYDAEESPLGDFVPEYWEQGPKEWMIKELANSYTSIGLLDGDLFRDYPNELHEAIREVMGYDGVEVSFDNTDSKFYVAWFDNQMKQTTNTKPTENPDIRYSMSTHEQGIAPTGKYNVYGKDIALERTVSKTENVAPVVQEKTDLVQEVVQETDEYAPMTETQANERDLQTSDRIHTLNESQAPMESDLYDDLDDIFASSTPEPKSPFDEMDIQEVGDRKQKAYMYENPEVKPYFQEEAKVMLGELRNSQKGERSYNDQLYYESGGEKGFFGTKRETSEQIAYLLDKFKYKYADIEKGLNAIIEDHGAENNAISKRIEFMLDERLKNGYTDFVSGMEIPANQEYLNFLTEKDIQEYSEEARMQYFESPEFAYSVSENTEDTAPVEEVAPVKDVAYEAIRPQREKEPKLIRVKDNTTPEYEEIAKILDAEPTTNKKNRWWAIFRANVLDKGSVFEDIALKNKNRNLMGKWNYTLYSESIAQRFMGNGNPEAGVKALNDIRAEVDNTGLTHEFSEYIYHKHNVDRMKLKERFDIENKPVFGYNITAEASEDIVKLYENAHPEFMDYAQDVYNYQNYLRQQLVDNGVISQETADLWSEMYPHYVPIRRINTRGNNINVALDTGRTGVNAPIKKATGGNTDILPLFDTMAMRTLQTYKATAKNSFGVELKNTLGTTIDKGSTNVDEVIESIDSQEELLQKGKNGEKPTFTVFENGERVTFEITEDMYDAIKPISEGLRTELAWGLPGKISAFHRGVLTQYNPVFILTNGIKDIQDVLINSQHPARTYAKIPEAFAQLTKKGYWYNEYMNNGGDYNSFFDGETNTFKTDNKGLSKLLELPPLSTISQLNNYIEMIPRLSEYIASREAGRSIEVSMLDSARVTTNFRAGGDLTKYANRNGATFLNASVQGALQQVRNVREAKANGLKGWANLATKFALAGAPAFLLNALLWDDDDEYEELSDYVKQNYYIVGKYDDGKFIRIPKGRTVAVIQDAIKQVSDMATGNGEEDLNSFLQLVVTNLAPANPIENNILAPIVQVKENKTWYGDDLVPTRLQDLPASEQYDESTDSISRWLGEKLDISPVKINYLLDQYTGGVGDMVLPMLTPEAESGDNSPLGNAIAPLKKKFTVDSVMNNQNISDFYDTSDELTTNAKKSTATDEDVLKNKYMNSIKAEMSDLYKQKREVQNSSLSDNMKYERVREIQSQIVALSKESLKAHKGVSIMGDYATVGDRHYKRSESGEWTKLTDKQLEKQEEVTSGLGISASEYWSNKEEYDYAYEKPEKYAMSKVFGGYESYKAYTKELDDITADKDENGKTINGSRKEKVLAYVDSLDADYGTKLILFKSVYNAEDDFNNDIIEYLNSRNDISYEEEVAILKELGFTVDSDGTIYWD